MGKVSSLDAYLETRKKTKPFGEHARLVRNNRVLTQRVVGEQVGVDRSTVSRWESGNLQIHPEDAIKIAAALNKPEMLNAYCENCPVAKALAELPKPAA